MFRTMVGPLDVPQNDMQIIERPGLDGFDLRKLGDHKKPFQILASRDARDISEARAFLANYALLVGADPVAMIWANYNLSLEGRKVAVLRVDQVELRAAFPIVNAIGPLPGYLLRTLWTLILKEDE